MIGTILIVLNTVLCGVLFAMGVIAARKHDNAVAVTDFLLAVGNLLCVIGAIR